MGSLSFLEIPVKEWFTFATKNIVGSEKKLNLGMFSWKMIIESKNTPLKNSL